MKGEEAGTGIACTSTAGQLANANAHRLQINPASLVAPRRPRGEDASLLDKK